MSCQKNVIIHNLSERRGLAGGRLSYSAVAVSYPDMSITPGYTSPFLGLPFFLLCQSVGMLLLPFVFPLSLECGPFYELLRDGHSI